MHVYYYYSNGRPERGKAVVQSIYGEQIEFISETPWTVIDRFEPGDILICHSVDELSDNTGIKNDIDSIVREYLMLKNKGLELVFDISTQCNSLFIKTIITNEEDFESVLRKCIQNYASQIDIQIKYRRSRLITAQANGNTIGRKRGAHVETNKSIVAKEKIMKLSRDFHGDKSDDEVIAETGISRNSYYKYKKELREESK